MLIRQKPENFANLTKVDCANNTLLQENGFIPLYYWDGFFYYSNSDELVEFLTKGGEIEIE